MSVCNQREIGLKDVESWEKYSEVLASIGERAVSLADQIDLEEIRCIHLKIRELNYNLVLSAVRRELHCDGLTAPERISWDELDRLFLRDSGDSDGVTSCEEDPTDPVLQWELHNKRKYFNASNGVHHGRWEKIPKYAPTMHDVACYLKGNFSAFSWAEANLSVLLSQVVFVKLFNACMFADPICVGCCLEPGSPLIPMALTAMAWEDLGGSDKLVSSSSDGIKGVVEVACKFVDKKGHDYSLAVLVEIAQFVSPVHSTTALNLDIVVHYFEENHSVFLDSAVKWKDDWMRQKHEAYVRRAAEVKRRNDERIAKLPPKLYTGVELAERLAKQEKRAKRSAACAILREQLEKEDEERERLRAENVDSVAADIARRVNDLSLRR
eukprot:gene26742-33368_t